MADSKTNKDDKKKLSSKKKKKHISALYAASMGRSATAQVDPHTNSGLANTGTNISYEGATAPGSGGSVGTRYSSGGEATGEILTTMSDYEQNMAFKHHKERREEEIDNPGDEELADEEQADDEDQ